MTPAVGAPAAPAGFDVAAAARDLTPVLRRHALWGEQNRRLHDEVVAAMSDAGLFRMRTPRRYGGFDSPCVTLVDVATQIGRVDGAAAWVLQVYWIPGWMVGFFPEETQDEVFADTDVRVSGTLSPSGSATPAAGGVVVDGRWNFMSGAWHCQWQELIAMAPTPDGQGMWPVLVLVPTSDLTLVDDWHTSGMRGSGSVSSVAEGVFVPQHRVLPLMALMQQQPASPVNDDSSTYRVPLNAYAAAATVGALLGIAKGSVDLFLDRLGDRKITYSDHPSQREAAITHQQVCDATLATDQAEFHALRVARQVDDKGAAGEEWTMEERARARVDVAAVADLAGRAVDRLDRASGGSSVREDVPIQRMARDIRALYKHPLINADIAYELYGRVRCGLPPNTSFV